MNIEERMGKMKYETFTRETILNKGNNYRLKTALEQECIHLAFLGGSVTLGYHLNTILQESYPFLLANKLQSFYQEKSMDFLNLGAPSVNSAYGLVQAERNITEFGADIIIIEYAVNEENTLEGICFFESLIRKLLMLETKPAVMILTLMLENHSSRGDMMLEVGMHYDLPVIALHKIMPKYMTQGEFLWVDYADDEVHGNESGHQLICDCLHEGIKYLTEKKVDAEYAIRRDCFYSAPFETLELLDFNHMEHLEGTFIPFYYGEKNPGLENDIHAKEHYLRFSSHCKCLLIVFVQSNQTSYGTAVVKINEESVCTLKGYSIFGWNNPVTQVILKSDINLLREVEIRMDKDDEKKTFQLHVMGYC